MVRLLLAAVRETLQAFVDNHPEGPYVTIPASLSYRLPLWRVKPRKDLRVRDSLLRG